MPTKAHKQGTRIEKSATGGPSSGPFSKQDEAIPWLNKKGAMNEVQQ
jgi:hypothetical protein